MRSLGLLLAGALSLPGATYFVTVAGLGGEPEFEQRFTTTAKEIDKLLKSSSGGAKVETLFGPAATKAKLTEILGGFSKSATAQDTLVVTLIGHGTFDNTDYKFNLVGPDLAAMELSTILDRFPGQQVVVNTTSASGGCLLALKRPGRAVITATKSGTERNATVFARYWAEALRVPGTDSDKNEVITALEAYRYANDKTIKFYEQQKRIATEHAQIEDTGKADATRDPSAENGQGLLAQKVTILRLGSAQAAAATPEKKALLEKKEAIEQQISSLKYRKAALPSDQYTKQLTELLVQLATTQAELDK